MRENILITGGAGFIGSHLADALLQAGHSVRVLDNLHSQVHGPGERRPEHLARDLQLIVGDVRDRAAVQRALTGIDVVFHFASLVGVGQSMYRMENYLSVNDVGTAVLLEEICKQPPRSMVVASSMSLYGEGLYRRADGGEREGRNRSIEQLGRREWELRDDDGEVLTPIPTSERKRPALESIYALSKYDQERMCLIAGRAYGFPVTALRFFNVYGPRQALSNPYTGVLAIFASRLLNDRPPWVFEDGLQRRDFVSVHDVVRACILAMESDKAAGHAVNLGSGESYTVLEIAERIASAVGKRIAPEIVGEHRIGDIRHCFADITLARQLLGYQPTVSFDDGLRELAEWLEGKTATDAASEARAELTSRGLTL